MSDLTTYRASKLTLSDWRGIADNAGVSAAVMFYIVDEVRSTLTPDSRLQSIADAPRCQHGMIDDHQYEKYGTYWGRQETFVRDCDGAEELRALLDALVEGTDDDS